MISLTTIAPPPDQPRNESENVLNLIAILADGKLTKSRLAALVEATAAARAEADALIAAKAALATAQTDKSAHDAKLASERAAHSAALKAERFSFDEECKRRNAEIARREADATRLLNQARDHEEKSRQAKLNLEARISKIKEAAEA